MAQRRGAAARGYAVILLVGFLETLELVVTARHDRVQRFLGGFLAAPDLLQFFVFDAADLYIVAQADATALKLGNRSVGGSLGISGMTARKFF